MKIYKEIWIILTLEKKTIYRLGMNESAKMGRNLERR